MKQGKSIDIEGLEEIGLLNKQISSSVATDEAQKLVDIIRRTMEEMKVTASYALVQSIEARIYKDGFDVRMDDYWKYVNEGVKGKKSGRSLANYAYTTKRPPIAAISRWESFKKTYKNVYALREVIYQRGIRPRQFIDKAIEQYQKL